MIPPFAAELLRVRPEFAIPNEHNAVFATCNGTWHHVVNAERRWRQIRKDTGYEWVTPHTFRKTVATLYQRQRRPSNGTEDMVSEARAREISAAFAKPLEYDRIREAALYDDEGFCQDCGVAYCYTHWNTSSTGGGRCPKGHFKSLDPHWSPEF